MLSSEGDISAVLNVPQANGSPKDDTTLETGSTGGVPNDGSMKGQSALLAALADPSFASTDSSNPQNAPNGLPASGSFPSLAAAASQSRPGSMGGAADLSASKNNSTWSSMDGIPRTAWQSSPSDGILQSTQPFLSSANAGTLPQRPTSTGPTLPGSLSQSLDSGFSRMAGLPAMNGAGNNMANRSRSNSLQQGGLPNVGAPGGNPLAGLTLAQQQLLQQQLLLQQQQQNKLNGVGQAPNIANLQAAAQAAAIRQQALLRQQQQQQQNQNLLLQQALLAQSGGLQGLQPNQAALLNALGAGRGGGLGGVQPQQQNPALRQGLGGGAGAAPAGLNQAAINALLSAQLSGQNASVQQALQAQNAAAQQQLLMAQLRAGGISNVNGMNGMNAGGAAGLQQRPPGQLQSEALIAMQRQQAAAAGVGGLGRMGSGSLGGLSQDQLQAVAQLGLLNKQGVVGGAGGNAGALNAQQQAALLNALQGGRGAPIQQQQFQQRPQQFQQQRPLAPPQLDATQQSLVAAALAQQQQLQGVRSTTPGLPNMQPRPQSINPAANFNHLAAAAGQQANHASDPIQTLQDIGRTLAQLGITVEAAVNAGLLGGLSASDVRIVAEAHRQDMDIRNKQQQQNAPSGNNNNASPFLGGGAGMNASIGGTHINGGGSASVPIGGGLNLSGNSLGGASSAPNPSSPAGSVGGASVSSAPARPSQAQISSSAPGSVGDDEDEVNKLLSEIDEEAEDRKKGAIDEAAIKAKVEEMAKQFDASQYGFFGAGGMGDDSNGTALLTAIENEGSSGLPDNLLPDELDSKLNLGGNTAGDAAGQQQQMASLWGPPAQGDRPDPFGTYLAGLRLGTGF